MWAQSSDLTLPKILTIFLSPVNATPNDPPDSGVQGTLKDDCAREWFYILDYDPCKKNGNPSQELKVNGVSYWSCDLVGPLPHLGLL